MVFTHGFAAARFATLAGAAKLPLQAKFGVQNLPAD
jgi:hypothetical protein